MLRPAALAASFAMLVAAAPPAQEVKVEWWQKTLAEALTAANDSKAGMVLLYCWRDDGWCSSMFSGTLSDAAVAPAIVDFVCMGAKDEGAGKEVLAKYSVTKVPTILFVRPDGQVVDVLVGYLPVQEFLAELKRIRAGENTIAALRDRIAAAPDDLPLQLELLYKLRRSGDFMNAKAVLEALVARDPKGKSEAACEAMFLQVCDAVFPPGAEPKDWDTKPLRSFLARQKHKRVLFLGYDRLAAAEWKKDDLKAAVSAAEKAWKSIPDEFVLEWGQNVAAKAYEAREELDKVNKTILKRAVEVSAAALDAVEKRHAKAPDKVWLANALYLHAAVLVASNQRKEAFATMDRAIELDPNNEGFKAAKKAWIAGEK